MTFRRHIILAGQTQRDFACAQVKSAPVGHVVAIRPPSRSLDANAKLHALLSDIVKAKAKWAGREWDLEEWKAIMVSAHAVATSNSDAPLIRGLEGELVQLRESTATMTVARASSLIEYVTAWCAFHGINLQERGQ